MGAGSSELVADAGCCGCLDISIAKVPSIKHDFPIWVVRTNREDSDALIDHNRRGGWANLRNGWEICRQAHCLVEVKIRRLEPQVSGTV